MPTALRYTRHTVYQYTHRLNSVDQTAKFVRECIGKDVMFEDGRVEPAVRYGGMSSLCSAPRIFLVFRRSVGLQDITFVIEEVKHEERCPIALSYGLVYRDVWADNGKWRCHSKTTKTYADGDQVRISAPCTTPLERGATYRFHAEFADLTATHTSNGRVVLSDSARWRVRLDQRFIYHVFCVVDNGHVSITKFFV